MKKETKGIWESIREPVLNSIKISLLETWDIIIIDAFSNRLEMVLRRYVKYLPKYVGESEIDDLRTISQLEFLETIKVWDPELCPDVWPLAQRRILGAMKDHIRYISKSDPTRFYDWITDAAYVFMAINKRADFENQIETGIQLNQAMSGLNYREKKISNLIFKKKYADSIILLQTIDKENKYFKQTLEQLNIGKSFYLTMKDIL